MKLELSKAGGLIKIDKLADDGSLVARTSSRFNNDDHFKKAAGALGIDVNVLMHYIFKFEKSEDTHQVVEVSLNPIDNFKVYIRSLTQEDSQAIEFTGTNPGEVFEQALQHDSLNPNSQPLIYWDDTKHLAAVDLDVEDGQPELEFEVLISTFTPCPLFAWKTHGGGLRLVYTSQDIFTAEELAALAIYTLSFTLEYKNIELKKSTRHPRYVKDRTLHCSEPMKFIQTTDITGLMKYLRRFHVDDKEVQEWLEEQGFEKGKRYPHTKCPVDPSKTGKSDCVLVGEKGIKCYICEAHGVTHGSHNPGFFPYAAFIENTESTLLYKCVKNYTHLEHARYILGSRFGIQGNFTTLCYSGLLKAINRSFDSRITDALYRGTNFIRVDNKWMTLNGNVYNKDIKPLLTTLPACQIALRNGKTMVDLEKLTKFQQTHDLTEYGYPSLTPIRGCKIGAHYLESEVNGKIYSVMHRSIFTSETMHLAPQYVKWDKQLLENAWKTLEKLFPGINRNLVYMLIAARGVMELEFGMPPFIYITGPTGAGKTSTVYLTAGIIGDGVTDAVWTNNIERVRQTIKEGKNNGSYVAFGEIDKESKHKKKSPVEVLDFLLNLTKTSASHTMYIGPDVMGTLPVIVFTDTGLSHDIKQDKQLARRIVHVELPSSVPWDKSLAKVNLSDISYIRLLSPKIADACNVILSHVIDTYFKVPMTFFDICELLGYSTLTYNEELQDVDSLLKKFYLIVSKAPALKGSDAVRWSGRGWKVINKMDTKSEILEIWTELCDSMSDNGFTSSRQCSATDWQKVMGAKEPIRFEIRPHGISKVAVRFRSVAGTKQDYKVNEELLT
jgi:hypothetical protein